MTCRACYSSYCSAIYSSRIAKQRSTGRDCCCFLYFIVFLFCFGDGCTGFVRHTLYYTILEYICSSLIEAMIMLGVVFLDRVMSTVFFNCYPFLFLVVTGFEQQLLAR